MDEPLPDPVVIPTDAELVRLFSEEGNVVTSELQGRMVAAYARPLLRESGWNRSMVLHAVELWMDSGYLSMADEDEEGDGE